MALRDLSCYTLSIRPSPTDRSLTELVELESDSQGKSGAGTPRYARVIERREGEAYSSIIYDHLTSAKLASVGYPTEKAKQRRLQLHGPDENVAFDFTGKIGFEWTFTFEGNKFRWSREVYGKDYICSIDRKPDPRVEICLPRNRDGYEFIARARDGEKDKDKPGRLQVLHYNIERFPDEIKDLRGLETLLVATLMCFVDTADNRASRPSLTTASSGSSLANPSAPGSGQIPERVITPEDFEPENPNEILVGTNTNIDEHVARAVHLLEDPNILFIVIRSKNSAAAQRALEVSLGVTRFRHREGMGDLHQYVCEEDELEPAKTAQPATRGPRVIKLDDEPAPAPPRPPKPPGRDTWTPPPNLVIFLSTIELPDLSPGRRAERKATLRRGTPSNAAGTNGVGVQQQKHRQKQNGTASAPVPALGGMGNGGAALSSGSGGSGTGTGTGNGNGNGARPGIGGEKKSDSSEKSKRESTFGKLFKR
ncbi:hypothetical protein EHS25_008227 [Saitozyma podzolica]|uniref:Uncharacterized protein n=1 Tax=Saitozyma podzolica TaxID=1890683 RepID=A0A427YNZ2_9TREE|nr:hypothetical protein EHS25_008227 [Saitozyma podzolica]